MPRVRVVHTTDYRYNNPVQLTRHRLMLRPRDSHDLRVVEATLGILPGGLETRWAHDVFGNSICYVDPNGIEATELQFVSTLELEHYPVENDLPIDPRAKTYPFSYPASEFPDLSRLIERHYLDPEGVLDVWVRKFVRQDGPTDTMALLTEITQAIKADFTYQARDAEGTNGPLETLATGTGACRDFALLMMEAARTLGFAARFISGYLYDAQLVDSPDKVVGGGATHAWCSIYLPGAGWIEFDPTNGLVAGHNLIRVCWARTPQQAVPIAGGYVGTAGDFAGMSVDVEVTVGDAATAPAEELEPEAVAG